MAEAHDELERAACVPEPVSLAHFNPSAVIPYGCTIEHLYAAMAAFNTFLGVVNQELHAKGMVRLESLLMPANFSSIVGEFVNVTLPRFCTGLVKNRYHNGHPDLIPASTYPDDSVQYASDGIEVKASRYLSGWQGHNIETGWLIVFVFDSNRPADAGTSVLPRPFRFVKVVGASLAEDDWSFSGRSAASRRTITASVTPTGAAKMDANWLYRAPDVSSQSDARITRSALGVGDERKDEPDED